MVLKTVAVTGAFGMLGRHVVSSFSSSGFHVVSISRSCGNQNNYKCWNLMQWNSDKEFDDLLSTVDVVVHSGASVPSISGQYSDSELFYANVGATLNLARWCRKNNIPLIYISGAIVYKNIDKAGTKENSTRGYSDIGGFYGQSKLFSEDLLYREKNEGLHLAIVRPSSIYGYGLSAEKIICSFLNKAASGDLIQIKEPINYCVDLIHAADVSSAIVEIVNKQKWDTYNISSGQCTSIIDIAETCISVVGNGRVKVIGEQTNNFKTRYMIDNRFSVKKLGWHPSIHLYEGITSVFEKKIIHAKNI